MEGDLPIASFDCGHRSLSWTIYLNHNDKPKFIFGYADLTSGKKLCDTDLKTIALNLKRVLNTISVFTPKRIIIEQQPAFNGKTCSIRDQLIYHFCETSSITLVNPAIKNKISFTEELTHAKYIAKSKSDRNYSANKAHARANFLWWIENTNDAYILPPDFTKRVYDIADSFLQLFGWMYFRIESVKEEKSKC